ncbi:hypothetical protein [Amycolatopsis sp. NPDC051371]|uniref:hypothetical protein n=1 Tax=Amycolatopsis sp. NPDC051371 TaxID=3155800 RepID=UPI003424E406
MLWAVALYKSGSDVLMAVFSRLGWTVRRSDLKPRAGCLFAVGACRVVLVPALGIEFVQALIWSRRSGCAGASAMIRTRAALLVPPASG